MKRLSIYLVVWAILASLGVCGCADDLKRGSVFDSGVGDAVILFSVEKSSLTRMEGNQDMESCIDHAYLMFYDAGDVSDRAVPLAAVRAEVDGSNPGVLKFKMPLRLMPDTDYRLVAVANADGYVPEGFNTFAEYLDSWCHSASESDVAALHLYRSDRILAGNVNSLPMRGCIPDDAPFRFSMQNGSYKVSASLLFRRLVARIDVANIVREGFDVEGVALCNWRDAVPVALSGSALGNRLGSVRGILSDEDEDTGDSIFLNMPADDGNGIQQLKQSVYCFPSVAYDSYPSDKESTALIIKARYQDDADPSYYRVNVGLSGNVSEVKANIKYLVTIQSVKGRGATSVEEAYAAAESPIVLSVVEDWDLEGNYAMDDKGNFIVLSSGNLLFDGDVLENREVKVLTSKGLTWTAEYVPEGNESSDAFRVVKLSDSSLAIGPAGENVGDGILSGKVRVAALTSDGGSLVVNIRVSQQPVEERPSEPVIPTNKPFALIPVDGERVKIDHDAETIEIDGFDPDCFNSFIDIPFSVYINSDDSKLQIQVRSDLLWPLEGAVSKKEHKDHFFCSNSFVTSGTNSYRIYSKTENKELSRQDALGYFDAFNAGNGDIVYISVGAMAPDDPQIVGTVTLSQYPVNIVYKLTIKPGPAIIDDVVLTDGASNWLVFDRNVQDLTNVSIKDYIGRKDGRKLQAYNYHNQWPAVSIPNKYIDALKTPFNESRHELYRGLWIEFSKRDQLHSGSVDDKLSTKGLWLDKYLYSDDDDKSSPFYDRSDEDIFEKWNYPTQKAINLCVERMRVSKLRMYLVSDIPVKSGKERIPVCCYWPYYGDPMDNFSIAYACGYYVSDSSGILDSMAYIYCDKSEMKLNIPSRSQIKNTYKGFYRLVRPLTEIELEDYKTNYLGYGSKPHRLTICHPDTYDSTSLGWLPY
ncbi:MAG: hypothetical protein K2H22_08035 [Muribaculaceae bacterium]|nr:hypothetical protein [Muribaculaceae bacterium]